MYSIIGLSIAGGLLALGIVAILIAGTRGLISGDQDLKQIGVALLPFIIFGVAYLLTNDFAEAGIATMVMMIFLMALSILATGTRTTFNL